MRSKTEGIARLRHMLHDMLMARKIGVSHSCLVRMQRSVDSAMCAFIESGQATKEELLELVALEQSTISGPATREISAEIAA